MKPYGYARVSTQDQNLNSQLDALRREGIEERNIFADKITGTDFSNRPEFNRLLKRLRAGDVLFLTKLDRLGRDYSEIKETWRQITKVIGANVVILDMPLLDTRQNKDVLGSLISDIVLEVFSYVADRERELISERTRAGLESARSRGHVGGRPRSNPDTMKKAIQMKQAGMRVSEICDILEIRISTFYKYWNESMRENEQ